MLRPVKPGDVSRSRAETLVRDAERLLAEGGEDCVRVLVRPDQPRHGVEAVA
jgi:hypothetical protein